MMSSSGNTRVIRFITLFILPFLCIFFFPIVEDPYDIGRWILLVGITIVICVLWTMEIIRTKSLTVSFNAATIGFGMLTLTSLCSVIVVSTNKIEALVHPLGSISWLCLTFVSFIAPSTMSKKDRTTLLWMIVVGTTLLGILIIYQQFAISTILFPTISYLADPLWNPTGTPLSACYLFAITIPLAIHLLRESGKQQEDRNSAFSLIAILVALSAIAVILWRYIPRSAFSLLPIPVGWGILMESWKQPIQAIMGIGVDQFAYAFTIGKQASINTTAIWNTAFNSNASLLLHLATVNGFLGACALLLFVIILVQSKIQMMALRIGIFFSIIFLLLFPPSFPLVILFALLCITSSHETQTHIYRFTSLGVACGSILCIGIVIWSSFYWFGYTKGEVLFYRGVIAQNKENNGTKAYNLMIRSIRQNPFISRYHATFSKLNLMLGDAIITNAQNQKLSNEDQQLVTTLLSQAISEAKTATTLAPTNVYIWSNLALLYQNLIGIAPDAQTFAIATYQKAITLDPVNPILRLDLGGLYVGMKDYDNAQKQFTAALALKPNYANGYYNLAHVYTLTGKTKEAQQTLQNVLELLPHTSSEYKKVLEELQSVQNQ